MTLTLPELYKGKATTIKSKEYLSTEKYVAPFIEAMSDFTDKFIINAILPQQLTIDQSVMDTTYNRVWVQAVLPDEYCIQEHDEVIGMIYAFDVRKPLYKVYRGYVNRACMNLAVFDPQWIEVQELQPNTGIKFPVKELMEKENSFNSNIKSLKETFLERDKVLPFLGKWVDSCLRMEQSNKIHSVKLSPDSIIEAYRSVFMDKNSTYYVPETREVSMFDIYGALTQVITDDKKDIVNKFEKTILINKILL